MMVMMEGQVYDYGKGDVRNTDEGGDESDGGRGGREDRRGRKARGMFDYSFWNGV
jgi:hypothetical protein